MGKICEIFGPITTPFYVVKWASSAPVLIGKNSSGNANASSNNSKKKKNKKRGSGASKGVSKDVEKYVENQDDDDNENENENQDENEIGEEVNGDIIADDYGHIEVDVEVEVMSGTHSMVGDGSECMVMEGEVMSENNSTVTNTDGDVTAVVAVGTDTAIGLNDDLGDVEHSADGAIEVVKEVEVEENGDAQDNILPNDLSASTSAITSTAISENIQNTNSQEVMTSSNPSESKSESLTEETTEQTTVATNASSAKAEYFHLLLSKALPGTQGMYVRNHSHTFKKGKYSNFQ